MRHRTTLGLGLLLALAALVVATASAATTSFSVTFKESFGRSVPNPCTAFLCGEGVVAGFGRATSTLEITGFANFDPESACGDATLLRTITFASGTLTLSESGTVCFPGRSFFTPGASSGHSYGNPARISTTWTVTGGTGAFAGASGTGTDESKNAGDAGHSTLAGTLTLP
jgi:hypothetical protein